MLGVSRPAGGGTGPTLARYHDSADTQLGEVLFDGGFAVPTVSGHGPGRPTGPGLTIVGDRDYGARIGGQMLFEPLHALGVEMVGRLVKATAGPGAVVATGTTRPAGIHHLKDPARRRPAAGSAARP